ncbi:MAG: RDD family protein [Bacteroidota bacterium]
MNDDDQSLDDKTISAPTYASFSKRVAAALIDVGVLIPLLLLSYYNMFAVKSYALAVFASLSFALYQPLMETRFQATVGKMVIRIKVLTEDLEQADWATIFVRNSLYLISAGLSLSSLWFVYQEPDFIAVDSWASFSSFVANQEENLLEGTFTWITFFSCWMVAFSRKRQALHDKMAKTVVVEAN